MCGGVAFAVCRKIYEGCWTGAGARGPNMRFTRVAEKGRINPLGNATRAQAAKMLVVFYDMLA